MLGSKFTFEAVGPNYLNLYDQIWNGHPSVL
jgi:hypothetical protein